MKRCYSLKRNKAFRYTYRTGKSAASRTMVLVYSRSREKLVQVGFSVSKKIGNSVVRNRVKRRLRESFGPMIPDVKNGYNLIFIAREPVVNDSFTNICATMRKLLRKANLLVEKEERQ
ncbi:MAG: ribonuclease P protein component [Clostridia bacterium]